MLEVTTRPPTTDESRVIDARAGFDTAAWGCLVIFLLVPVTGFPLLGGLVGSWFDYSDVGLVVGAVGAAVFVVAAVSSHAAWIKPIRERALAGQRSGHVEIWSVMDADVISLVPHASDDPAMCFDGGDGQLLLVRGQLICDPSIYGVDDDALDEEEGGDRANFLPEPCSFPRTQFEIVRVPHSGEILSIALSGKYVHPRTVAVPITIDPRRGDCVPLEGTFDDLEAALAPALAPS